MKYKIAVASTDGKVVNEHFGRATCFYILEAVETGAFRCLETRETEPVCESGNHREDRLMDLVESISDCGYVLVSRIGKRAEMLLEEKGILVFELPGIISESVDEMVKYLEIQHMIGSYL